MSANLRRGPLTALCIASVVSLAAATAQAQCGGDFNLDGQVTIDEILTAVNNALNGCPDGVPALALGTAAAAGTTPIAACDGDLPPLDGRVTIDEILTIVANALNGCPSISCSLDFLDDVGSSDDACNFTANPICVAGTAAATAAQTGGLEVFFLSNGQDLFFGVVEDTPERNLILVVTAIVDSETSATVNSWSAGPDQGGPVTGTASLNDDGASLTVTLDEPLPDTIAGCPLLGFEGGFQLRAAAAPAGNV